jgi:uncharacterized damage-inducible protein DinB
MSRSFPGFLVDERTSLVEFLDFHRATFLEKSAGLTHAQLNQALETSTLTLAGLMKHLAHVEDNWMQVRFLDGELPSPWDTAPFDVDPDWDFHSAPNDTPEELVALYQAACDRSRSAVELIESMDTKSKTLLQPENTTFTLRWMLLHLIEETARHNGHADLLREAIDGLTGE